MAIKVKVRKITRTPKECFRATITQAILDAEQQRTAIEERKIKEKKLQLSQMRKNAMGVKQYDKSIPYYKFKKQLNEIRAFINFPFVKIRNLRDPDCRQDAIHMIIDDCMGLICTVLRIYIIFSLLLTINHSISSLLYSQSGFSHFIWAILSVIYYVGYIILTAIRLELSVSSKDLVIAVFPIVVTILTFVFPFVR